VKEAFVWPRSDQPEKAGPGRERGRECRRLRRSARAPCIAVLYTRIVIAARLSEARALFKTLTTVAPLIPLSIRSLRHLFNSIAVSMPTGLLSRPG